MKFLAASTILASVLLPMLAAASDVLLTVTGLEEPKEYALEDLRAMEATEFTTTTTWTTGDQTFRGVSLKQLLDELEVTDGTLRASAINDYTIEVPVSDGVEGGPIIAYERNGEEMSVRDKGPLWLVYPYDLNPDYQTEVIYSRSIWQLVRIEVLP